MDRGAWWVTVHEVAKTWTQLSRHTDTKGKAKVNSLIWGPHVSDSLGPAA